MVRVPCPYCAEDISAEAKKCKHCGEFVRDSQQRFACFEAGETKSSGGRWAALSFLLPGVGQICKGNVGVGILWFFSVAIGYALFLPLGAIVHLCCVFNAFGMGKSNSSNHHETRPSERTNQQERSVLELLLLSGSIFFLLTGVTWFVISPWKSLLLITFGALLCPPIVKRWRPCVRVQMVVFAAAIVLLVLIVVDVRVDDVSKHAEITTPHAGTKKTGDARLCDQACRETLGEKRVRFVAGQSCDVLYSMLTMDREKNEWAWQALIQDTLNDLNCGRRNEDGTLSASYEPAFAWQKRCTEACARILGQGQMADIDSWDCRFLRNFRPYAINPRRYDDYDRERNWYDAWAMAVLDKSDATSC